MTFLFLFSALISSFWWDHHCEKRKSWVGGKFVNSFSRVHSFTLERDDQKLSHCNYFRFARCNFCRTNSSEGNVQVRRGLCIRILECGPQCCNEISIGKVSGQLGWSKFHGYNFVKLILQLPMFSRQEMLADQLNRWWSSCIYFPL